MIGEDAEADAAGDRAEQRPGREGRRLGLGQAEIGADRSEHEAEDQEVESVHGIAGRRGDERLAGIGGDVVRGGGGGAGGHGRLRMAPSYPLPEETSAKRLGFDCGR